MAVELLKGYNVHRTQSWQRVRDCVCSSNDVSHEKKLFALIASSIQKLPSGSTVCNTFEVLCKRKSASTLLGKIKGFSMDDTQVIDKNTDWTAAKRWTEWWMHTQHLRMLNEIIQK